MSSDHAQSPSSSLAAESANLGFGLARLIRKEIFDLTVRPLFLFGALLLSVLAVWVSGQLNSKKPVFHVFIYTGSASADAEKNAFKIIGEFSNVEITRFSDTIIDFDKMQAAGARIAAIHRENRWEVVHTSPTLRQESEIGPIVSLISSSLNSGRPWLASSAESSAGKVLAARVSAFPGDSQLEFVPKTVALIVIFLPFMIAGRSYSREISSQMLPTLLVASKREWMTIVVTKIAVSAWTSLIILLLLVLGIKAMFGITPKTGLIAHVGVQLLGMVVSAGLGLFAAITLPGPAQIHISSAVYFLALVLLSGFLFPLETASQVISYASNLSPLTFSGKIFESWLFHGTSVWGFQTDLWLMAAQLLLVTVLLTVGIRLARSRL